MKLYATTTSERASKGQGGKWLKIHIYNDIQQEICRIYVEPTEKGNKIELFELNESKTSFISYLDKPKANKKKDETHVCIKGEKCNHYSHIMN